VNSEGHTSAVVDQDYPQMIEICAELKRFSGLMHGVGHVTYTKFVLQSLCCMMWKKKKRFFHYHSKKLAIALGHINTTPDTPL
jgi:hypothetical protein